MDVYEVAREVHDRVNGGDESKFPKTLLVVAEFLYVCKPINYFGWCTRSIARGDSDEGIISACGDYYDDSLGPIIELQGTINDMRQGLVELKSKVVRVLCVSTLLTGVAIGCYMVFR